MLSDDGDSIIGVKVYKKADAKGDNLLTFQGLNIELDNNLPDKIKIFVRAKIM
jgi:hypothetical protein